MAETLTISNFKFKFSGTLVNDDALAPANVPLELDVDIDISNGAAADSVNKIYFKRLTLAATTAANLDLAGTLTNPLGTAVVFSKVRAIVIFLNPGTNTGPLLVGGHATAALSTMFTATPDLDTAQAKLRLRNGTDGGLMVLTAMDATALVVTATTEDMLTIYNEGSATATYDILVLGE